MQNKDKLKLRTGILSTFITFLLALFKFIGHIYTGSSALLADSLHSLTDSVSSVFVSLGIYLSTRKSERFPYGLYKVENLVSLVVALLVIFAGIEIVLNALKGTSPVVNESIGLFITALSVFISVFLGLYKITVSRKTNSPSLKADGYHSISDAFSSIVVFEGLLLYPVFPHAEKVASIIVAIILIYAGFGILKTSLLVLLDSQLREENLEKIMKIIKGYRGVRINFIRGRSSGSHYFIELGISIPGRNLIKAHEITEEIERKIKDTMENVEDVVIHYEPLSKQTKIYAIPLKNEEPTAHIGKCEKFLIFEERYGDRRKCFLIDNPGFYAKSGRGALSVKTLLEEEVDVILLKEARFEGMLPVVKEFFIVDVNTSLIDEILQFCKNNEH